MVDGSFAGVVFGLANAHGLSSAIPPHASAGIPAPPVVPRRVRPKIKYAMKKDFPISVAWLKEWELIPQNQDVQHLIEQIAETDTLVNEPLFAFCTHTRGTPDSDTAMLEDVVKTGIYKGTITGNFEESWNWGCKDMDGFSEQEFRLQFTIIPATNIFRIEWQESENPSPAEEL